MTSIHIAHARTRVALALLGFVASTGLAFADGSGTLIIKGQTTAFKTAYAYRHADDFQPDQQITTVVLSDKPIDVSKVNDAVDREDALKTQLRELNGNRVELNIRADGTVENVNTMTDGTSGSVSGSGWYAIDLKRNDDKRIEGTFRSSDEKDKKEGSSGYFDLKFALDLPGAPDLGTPLPADGGELGKVYRAYSVAVQKSDVDAMIKFMVKARAASVQSHRTDPNFNTMLGFIRESAIKDAKIVKGYTKADNGTLTVSGKDGSSSNVESTISFAREDGAWRIGKESVTSLAQ